jgi:Uma2 family endonuclease
MAGATRRHNLITGNLLWALKSQLRERPGEAYMSLTRVKVSTRGIYINPDIAVVRDSPQFEDSDGDTLLNPTLIVEVLSPSTEAYDRGAKFGYYRALPSVQEYVLVTQDQARMEHYVRAENSWVYTAITDLTAEVQLPSIDCTIPMAEVYDQITFSPAAEVAGPGETGDQQAP